MVLCDGCEHQAYIGILEVKPTIGRDDLLVVVKAALAHAIPVMRPRIA